MFSRRVIYIFAYFVTATGIFLAMSVATANAQSAAHFPVRSTAGWTAANAQLRSPFWNRRIVTATPMSYGFSRYPRPNYRNGWLSNRPNNGWGGTGYHPAPWHASQSAGGWLPR